MPFDSKNILTKILKYLAIFIIGLVCLFSILFILLQVPQVQNYLGQQATSILSKKINSKISINQITTGFLKDLYLKGIYLEDQNGDTLLYSKKIEIDFSLLALLKKEISIEQLKLNGTYIHVYRLQNTEAFNYTFLTEAFKDSSHSKSDWTFTVNAVELNNYKISYADHLSGIEFYNKTTHLDLTIENLGTNKNNLKISEVNINNAQSTVYLFNAPKKIPKEEVENNFYYTISNISLSNSGIVYNNYQKDALEKGMDYNRLNIFNINGSIKKVQIDTTTKIVVDQLSLEEKSGFQLNTLKGKIISEASSLEIELEKFITPQSTIHDKLTLHFPNTDLKNNSSIGEIAANGLLKKEIIAIQDLYYFIPDLDTIQFIKNKKIELSGNIRGKLKDFTVKNFSLLIDEKNNIEGNFSIIGLPELDNTKFDISELVVKTNNKTLQHFINDKKLPINLTALGNIELRGKANGSVHDFSINIYTQTSIGNIKSDFAIRIDNDYKPETFHGNITTSKFDVRKFLKEDYGIGKVSMSSFVSTIGKDDYRFETQISLIEYKKYPYKNIDLNGTIENDSISTHLVANDSNLQVELNLNTNLQGRPSSYKVEGVVRNANLYALNLTKNPLTIKTFVNADLRGNEIDSITGNFLLIAFELNNQKINYEADSIIFLSKINNNIHTISFNAPELKADISGQYRIKNLPDAALHFIHHYYSGIKEPDIAYHPKSLDFNIHMGNIGPLLNMFVPEIQELDNADISGSFKQGNHTLTVDGNIESMILNNNQIENLELTINADKKKLNFTTLAKNLTVNKNTRLSSLQLEGAVINDHVAFNFKLFDQKAPTRVNINGKMELVEDTVQLQFINSQIFIKGNEWDLHPNNLITYSKNYLSIKNLELQQGEQSIVVNSKNSSLEKTNIDVNVIKVHLNDLTELLNKGEYEASGKINGHLSLTDLFEEKGMDADLKIDSLSLNNIVLGNLILDASKAEGNALIQVNGNISGSGNEAHIAGNYLMGENGQISMNLNIKNIPLQPFEPFVKNILFKLDGSIAGDLQLKGPVSSPQLNGKINFKESTTIGLKVTNTAYTLNNQSIYFNSDAITFDHLVANDPMNNSFIAEGNIFHEGFKNYRFDLHLQTDRFMIVNSKYSPDVSFYGKLFIKAGANIEGPVKNLAINMSTVTLEGSEIFIPLTTTVESQGLPGYIRFEELDSLDPGNKNKGKINYSKIEEKEKEKKVDFSKFNVKWNLKVTSDASINIIVDSKNGDMITGAGEGDFMLDFDSENHINVYGTYEINKGSYEFTFLSLIKKKFSIEKGSTVTWAGDIRSGVLDITALYKTKASRYGLVQDQADFLSAGALNASKENLPVDVYLYLTGALTRPDLAFNIVIPEGDGEFNNSLVVQRINEIKNNPTELNKQVFSLIVFNRFLETGSQNTSAGSVALGQVNQSVSSILNSQLEKLSDNVLNGLDVNVSLESIASDYGPLGQRAKISTSKQISERITVSAGGSVNLYGGYGSGQFAGDYNVYYRLNESGSVNIKFFRTSQQNLYTNYLYTRSGASLNYKKDFNKWNRIFKKSKNKEED